MSMPGEHYLQYLWASLWLLLLPSSWGLWLGWRIKCNLQTCEQPLRHPPLAWHCWCYFLQRLHVWRWGLPSAVLSVCVVCWELQSLLLWREAKIKNETVWTRRRFLPVQGEDYHGQRDQVKQNYFLPSWRLSVLFRLWAGNTNGVKSKHVLLNASQQTMWLVGILPGFWLLAFSFWP